LKDSEVRRVFHGGEANTIMGISSFQRPNSLPVPFSSIIHALAAGARAFRQAIDAVMQGIKDSDYAEEYEEFKVALTK
jgi:hypothetical protein